MRLTTKTIEALKPPEKGTRVITDQGFQAPGVMCRLELRVGKTRKTWAVYYRFRKQRTRRNLGHYCPGAPGHLSLAEARAEAMKRATLLFEDKDPFGSTPKHVERKFEVLLDKYIAHISEPISESGEPRLRSWKGRGLLLARKTKELHGLDVQSISQARLRELVRKVRFDEKHESEATLLRTYLKRFWDWLEEIGAAELNPVEGIKIPAPPKPAIVNLTPEEVGRLWRIWEVDALSKPSRAVKALALQFVTLTALRRQECVFASWAELDEDRQWLTIPVTRFDEEEKFVPGLKSTSKKERIHDVYVGTPQAQRILDRLDELGQKIGRGRGGKPRWLFPNPKSLEYYKFSAYDYAVRKYRKKAETKHLGFHRLRHFFSTTAEDPKYVGADPIYGVGFVMGHTPDGITEKYIRRNRERIRNIKKEVATAWHAWVEKFGQGIYS